VRAFTVAGTSDVRPATVASHSGAVSVRTRVLAAAAAAAILIATGGGGWWLWSGRHAGPEVLAVPSPTQPFSAPRLSIVVLPFANLSNDPAQEYFADGITDDLTTDLSRIPDSLVIARNTAFTYKGKPVDAKQIGRQLGVRYVLEGSVQRSGNQVRINAQLIDTETGAHLWAERFDRDIGDLFALQNEITARIARALQQQFAIAEASRPIARPDAVDWTLRGRAVLTRPISKENYEKAISLFETALALDPKAPDAAAWQAIVLAVRVFDELSDSPQDDLQRAEKLAAQALAEAPSSAIAHMAMGQVYRAESRCREAMPEFEAAIAIDRSRAPAYAHIGWCKFLTGSVDEVVPNFERAIRLSPNEPGIALWHGRLGIVELLQSHTDEALSWLEKANSENPRLPVVHAYLAAAYALKGQTERARAALAEAQRLSPVYANLASVQKSNWYDEPKIRALAEATYFSGLRKAGLPEE